MTEKPKTCAYCDGLLDDGPMYDHNLPDPVAGPAYCGPACMEMVRRGISFESRERVND